MCLKLPIVENPIIKCYLHHAHTQGIILNEMNSDLWTYSHFLQLYSKNNSVVPMDFFINPYDLECLNRGYIPSFYINNSNISDFINKALLNGYYVVCLADEFYLEQMSSYNKHHFDHWILIYGYTDNGYLCIGYINNRLYKKYTVSFDVFYVAIQMKYGITLYKVKEEYIFNYNNDLAYDLLFDYTYGINTSYKYQLFKKPIEGKFGYKVYDYLEENLEKKIDCRLPYILYEHKKCIFYFLARNNYNDSVLTQYNDVVTQSAVLKNLYIKESIVTKKRNINKLLLNIEKLKSIELDILRSIF